MIGSKALGWLPQELPGGTYAPKSLGRSSGVSYYPFGSSTITEPR